MLKKQLLNGNWQHLYVSQSEADFALIKILASETSDKQEIKNQFMKSALGQREKAKRLNYVDNMIDKAFSK
jgi:primase-polymerase (primpol)-like protein